MKSPLIPLIALVLVATTGRTALANDKQTDMASVLKVVQRIYSFGASQKWIELNSDAPLDPFIAKLSTVRELEKCAILCMQMAYPMEAGEGGFDSYFHGAYGACVSKLSRIKGSEAADALKTIEWETHADGGERELLDDSIEHQKKL